MTVRGTAMAFFPLAHLTGLAAGFLAVCRDPVWWRFVLWTLLVYLPPPLLHRLHDYFAGPPGGTRDLSSPRYDPWWGRHQLQLLYIAVPTLESLLRLVPGLYSAWLRLWGSRIGRGVHWTPTVRIADRATLDVGNGVVFGHAVELYGHAIKKTTLFEAGVHIGDGAFIGGGSRLGPGSRVDAAAFVPVLTILSVRERFPC